MSRTLKDFLEYLILLLIATFISASILLLIMLICISFV